jgi:spore germination protein GerM
MRRVILLLALTAAVVACGLPSDNEPRQIADDKVPFELLGPSTTNPPSQQGGALVQLYFLDGEKLRPVNRSVTDRQPQTVLAELVKGVTESDPTGVTTAIPKDTQIVRTAFDGDNLVVTLNAAFFAIGDPGQKNAFAQLVYTVTEIGVPGVRFRSVDANGGNEIDVSPSTDVGQKQGPVTRSDFAQLSPK